MFSVVVFQQDRELRYTWMVHPTYGVMTEKVFGKTDAELFPESEATVLMAEKLQVLKTGKGARKKIQRTVDGKAMEVDLVLEPLRNEEGTVIGITGVSTDITQRNI